MQPHEQRVLDERNDLGEKMRKLDDFLASDTAGLITLEERSLLQIQKAAMSGYWHTLNARIARFT